MKSDREFLDGIYVKAEKLTSSNSVSDYDMELYENNNQQNKKFRPRTTNYIKAAGVLVASLLVISSSINIYKPMNVNHLVDNRNMTRNTRMIDYYDQLIERATDIIEVKAKSESNLITLEIIGRYKDSKSESKISGFLNNDVVGLTIEQSAILFIDADSKDGMILDFFTWDSEKDCFINSYGEIITQEILDDLN